MDGASLLTWRIKSALSSIQESAGEIEPSEWLSRPYPGANRIGFTCWHVAATIDWTVNLLIRGGETVVSRAKWVEAGFGHPIPFGMTLAEADAIAESTDPTRFVDFAQAVRDEVGEWLGGVGESDLDAIPPTRDNLAGRPSTPEYLAELTWMWDAPVYQLLGRPAMGHAFMHLGEVETSLAVVRSHAG